MKTSPPVTICRCTRCGQRLTSKHIEDEFEEYYFTAHGNTYSECEDIPHAWRDDIVKHVIKITHLVCDNCGEEVEHREEHSFFIEESECDD